MLNVSLLFFFFLFLSAQFLMKTTVTIGTSTKPEEHRQKICFNCFIFLKQSKKSLFPPIRSPCHQSELFQLQYCTHEAVTSVCCNCSILMSELSTFQLFHSQTVGGEKKPLSAVSLPKEGLFRSQLIVRELRSGARASSPSALSHSSRRH